MATHKKPSRGVFTPELDEMFSEYATLNVDSPRRSELRDAIVQQVMPYVKKIGHGLARRSTDPVDDIIQVGSIGLMKAVEKFDPFCGTSFKTYSTYLITGEIRHYLRDKTSMIKAPRQIYELYYRINQIVQKLAEELDRTPTDLEIAEFLECPLSKVTQAQEVERRRQPVSLDQFLTKDSSDTGYVERLVDERYFEMAINRENKIYLENAMASLKEELRSVVKMTYYEDMSQTEIAKELGISQMQVSRRLKKALNILLKSLDEPPESAEKPEESGNENLNTVRNLRSL